LQADCVNVSVFKETKGEMIMEGKLEKTLTVTYKANKKLDVNAKVILWEKLKKSIGHELKGFCADYNDFCLETVTKTGKPIIVTGSWILK
jgi:hypothetical protein